MRFERAEISEQDFMTPKIVTRDITFPLDIPDALWNQADIPEEYVTAVETDIRRTAPDATIEWVQGGLLVTAESGELDRIDWDGQRGERPGSDWKAQALSDALAELGAQLARNRAGRVAIAAELADMVEAAQQAGMTEVAIAAAAGVDRMTVRAYLGKR